MSSEPITAEPTLTAIRRTAEAGLYDSMRDPTSPREILAPSQPVPSGLEGHHAVCIVDAERWPCSTVTGTDYATPKGRSKVMKIGA